MAIIKEGTDSWLQRQIEFMEHGLKIHGDIEIRESCEDEIYSEWGTCRVDSPWTRGGALVFFQQSNKYCDQEGVPILEIHAIDERVTFGPVWRADRAAELAPEIEAIWAKLSSKTGTPAGTPSNDDSCPW